MMSTACTPGLTGVGCPFQKAWKGSRGHRGGYRDGGSEIEPEPRGQCPTDGQACLIPRANGMLASKMAE